MPKFNKLKVALVHDDLVQWGGAERVLLGISEIFKDAPIYTSVFDETNPILISKFGTKKIITSFMQKIPEWKFLYKSLLPLYPMAFEQFDFSNFDLVISQTTRFAKAIITKPQTLHICYCHTPPRFLWKYSLDENPSIIAPYLSFLRVFDQIIDSRVDYFIAGSANAQKRIGSVYKRKSYLCRPFVDDIFFQEKMSFDGRYFLIVSRLNKYKKIDLAVDVFNGLRFKLKIVGSGPEISKLRGRALSNIEIYENLSDDMLVNLYAGCIALIIPGDEDFGITALESQAMGKPVVAFRESGSKEVIIDKITGILFNTISKEALTEAVRRACDMKFDAKEIKTHARNFTKKVFLNEFQNIIKGIIE